MKSGFKTKVECAQLVLKYIGAGRGFETAIESIGLLARWKAWPQSRPTQRAATILAVRDFHAEIRIPLGIVNDSVLFIDIRQLDSYL